MSTAGAEVKMICNQRLGSAKIAKKIAPICRRSYLEEKTHSMERWVMSSDSLIILPPCFFINKQVLGYLHV